MKRRNFLKSLLGVPLGISLWPKKAEGFTVKQLREWSKKAKAKEPKGVVCPNCGRDSEWVWVEVRTGQQYSLMRFVGCDKCRRSGYMGSLQG